MLRKIIAYSLPLLLLAPLAGTAGAEGQPLSLTECLHRAEQNSPALKLARHDSGIQAENVKIAESGYYPKVDLQAGYTALVDPQAIKFATGSFDTQQSSFPY